MRRRFLALIFGVVVAGCVARSEASVGQGGALVEIATASGKATRFEPAEVSVENAGWIVLTFRNESSQAHNIVFTGEIDAATRTIVEPGDSDEITFTVPGPGEYSFVCTIHEGMGGFLSIGVAPEAR
jgi:plastocyanin